MAVKKGSTTNREYLIQNSDLNEGKKAFGGRHLEEGRKEGRRKGRQNDCSDEYNIICLSIYVNLHFFRPTFHILPNCFVNKTILVNH